MLMAEIYFDGIKDGEFGWTCVFPVCIFGYVPIREKCGSEDIMVVIDGMLMRDIRDIKIYDKTEDGRQAIKIIGNMLVRAESLKYALQQTEHAIVEIIGEKWSGFLSGSTIDVIGPAKMKSRDKLHKMASRIYGA